MPGDDPSAAPPRNRAALAICRGVRRHWHALGWSSLREVTLANGRRADVVGLAPDGGIAIAEIKSSVADFRSDLKWHEYGPFCDRFWFAVGPEFPQSILPESCGILVADGYGAAEIRPAAFDKLVAARRRAVMLRFALAAAQRLHRLEDAGLDP